MASSPWAEIASWVLLPAVLGLLSVGWSVAFERVARVTLPDGLLLPLGFSATLALSLLAHVAPGPWGLWIGLIVAVPLVALALVRPDWRRFTAGRAGLAGLAVYLLYLSPVLLSFEWTWSGYNFLNDTNYQFLLADWIRSDAALPAFGESNGGNALRAYVETDYPLGSHAHLGMLTGLLRIPVEVGYQAYIAAAAGVAAMAVQYALATMGMRARWAAVGAAASLSAALTVQFGLQGSIKEIAFLSTLLIGGAVVSFLTQKGAPPVQAAIAFGVTLAGALAAYSGAAIPFLAILTVVALIGYLASHGWRQRTSWVGAGAALATFALLALPLLGEVTSFARIVLNNYSGEAAVTANSASALGQLQAPLKGWQLFGVWLRGEYIYQLKGSAVWMTQTCAVIIGALGLGGLVHGLVRRSWGLLALVLPATLGLAALAPRTTPYVDAKLYAIAAPAVLIAAATGVWLVSRLGRRLGWAAAPLGAAAIAGVLASDGMAVHTTPLAPTDRLENIVAVGERYAGRGPVLFNEFEEFAKYFGRKARLNVSTDSTATTFITLRNAGEPFVGRSYDLDQQTLESIEAFPYVVLRRKPGASRPPANYELDYTNDDYAVWRRLDRPKVVTHFPLGSIDHPFGSGNFRDDTPSCREARTMVERLGDGEQLVAARGPEQAIISIPASLTYLSRGWAADPLYPSEVLLDTPGRSVGTVSVQGGRYDVWIRGSFGRPVTVLVAEKRIGQVEGINTPAGWLKVGTTEIPKTGQSVRISAEVRRRGGGLAAGDAARSRWGGLALVASGPDEIVPLPRTGAIQRLCHERWDWVEVVDPQG